MNVAPRLPILNTTLKPITLLWVVIALACGAILALLPLELAVAALTLAILIVVSLIDIRAAIIITLVISPLKILTESEIQFARDLPIDIGQIAFLFVVVIWLAKSIAANRKISIPYTPILIPVMLMLIAVAFSLWNTVALWSTVKELAQWAEIAVMLILVVSAIRNGDISWLVIGLVAAGCAQALIGIYQFRGGSGAPHLWILGFRYFRAFGSFGQPNPFGAFMSMTLCVALGAAYGSAVKWWNSCPPINQRAKVQEAQRAVVQSTTFSPITLLRSASSALRYKLSFSLPSPLGRGVGGEGLLKTLIYLAAFALLAVGLLVSWSRGAWMGFGAAAAAMLLFAPRRRIIGVGLVALVVIGLIVSIITGLAPDSLVSRLSDFTQDLTGTADVRGAQINDDNFAVIERLAHWQAAIGMATDNPWTGVGFGAYEIAYPRYALMNWPMALGHAHNFFLNLFAETGVIGLAAYLIAWVMIVVLTLRVLHQHSGFERGVALGILGVWAHITVHSLFDKLLVNNVFLHFGAMLGLIGSLLLSRRNRYGRL